jgi:hypothetical protein
MLAGSITRFKKTALLTAVRRRQYPPSHPLEPQRRQRKENHQSAGGRQNAEMVGAISLGLIDTYHPTVASAVRDGAGTSRWCSGKIATHKRLQHPPRRRRAGS